MISSALSTLYIIYKINDLVIVHKSGGHMFFIFGKYLNIYRLKRMYNDINLMIIKTYVFSNEYFIYGVVENYFGELIVYSIFFSQMQLRR